MLTLKTRHPLHALRKLRLFRLLVRWIDPMIPRRLPPFQQPVYLRIFSHGAQIICAPEREEGVLRSFGAVLEALARDRPAAFWDVGANIGWFGWHCVTLRPDLELVSFEPDPKNLRCLRRTSQRWKMPRHTVVPCAVADRSGPAIFFVDDISGATGSLEKSQAFNLHHYGHSAPEVAVQMLTLDDFMASRTVPPGIIKIDVEGAELKVLQGAEKVIREHRPILFYESFNHRAEILALLRAHDYLVYESDRHQAVSPETTNFLALPAGAAPVVMFALAALGYPVDSRHE